MKDAISYIRVSSEEQADSGLGLEAHLRAETTVLWLRQATAAS